MRQSVHVLRTFVLLLVLSIATHAHADDRSEARTHYQTAAKLYTGGDYRGAIREFSAAQQLLPADLNNYNLALCYDKLGDAEPAVQYYRAFLDKQPGTDKRAEIEASIARLDAASKSAASKKADEARKADEAKRKADEDASRPVLGPAVPGPGTAVAAPPTAPSVGPQVGPAPAPVAADAEPRKPKHRGPAVSGSLGGPSSGTPAASGDAQLDRVNAMNIDEIRDQRMGGVPAEGPAAQGQPQGQGQYAQGGQPPPPTGVAGPTGNGEEPKKETPIYKKWWFWAVVAVGGYVVYEIANTSSSPSNGSGFSTGTAHPTPKAGLTLLSW